MIEPQDQYCKARDALVQLSADVRRRDFFGVLIASAFLFGLNFVVTLPATPAAIPLVQTDAATWEATLAGTLAGTPQEQTQAGAAKDESKPLALEAVALEPGKPLERELKGGEKHNYEIRAESGMFLHAEVEQLGIDVALTLYAADGKPIASMDSPNADFGPEKISTIAAAPGIYRLEVASNDENVPAGRYRVTVDAAREPTDRDRARIRAERIFFAAEQLQEESKADASRDAIEKYDASLPLWRTAGDGYEEALTQTCIGNVREQLGETRNALDHFLLALAQMRAVGSPSGTAQTLTSLGQVYDALGEREKALEYLSQALPLEHKLGDRFTETSTLGIIAEVYYATGQKKEALDYFEQAELLAQAAGDQLGEATTLSNIGQVHADLGEMGKALEYLNRALTLQRQAGDKAAEARTLNNISGVYSDLGEQQKSLDYAIQALPLLRGVGNRAIESVTLGNIGAAYSRLGAMQKALEYLSQALPVERELGDRSAEAATLCNIGGVYFALGEKQKSLEYNKQAMLLARTAGNQSAEAIALNNIGRVQADLGERRTAIENFNQGLALYRAAGDPLGQALVLTNMLATWRDEKQPETAIFFGKQAVNQIQQVRSNIRGLGKEEQRAFLNSKEKTYRSLAALLISQGRLPEAEQVLELLKNEEYFEFIRRDDRHAASLTAPLALTKNEEELAHKYEENADSVTAAGHEWAALRAKPSRTPEEEKQLAELHDRLDAANKAWSKFLDNLYVELGDSKQAQRTVENLQENASSLQGVVRQLGNGTVALYTLVGEEKYHVVLVTPTVQLAREYPISAGELDKKVAAFRRVLLDPESDPVPKARELYQILVGPIAKDLQAAQATTLMWSLDGALRYIPLAALHDGREYLVEKYRNIVFTPASIAKLTALPTVSQWHGLGMGVSKSYGGFSALPSVPAELRAIIRETGTPESAGVLPGHTLLDDTFTEDNLKKGLLANYPLVHIASHFVFGAGNDTESYLLLGGTGAAGQKLTLAEINDDPDISFNDVELLTLSACNTALSTPGDGREVDGLGILAQRKGAKAVMATLWSVYDPSTSELMQNFYRNWTTGAQVSKAEALRRAQLALLHGAPGQPPSTKTLLYAHPYYWAPFILIGNWQ